MCGGVLDLYIIFVKNISAFSVLFNKLRKQIQLHCKCHFYHCRMRRKNWCPCVCIGIMMLCHIAIYTIALVVFLCINMYVLHITIYYNVVLVNRNVCYKLKQIQGSGCVCFSCMHLKMRGQKLLDNRCYLAILKGYFNGSNWGECDFVCTMNSPLQTSLPNARTRLNKHIN